METQPEVHEVTHRSGQVGQLVAALAKAKLEFTEIKKDKQVDFPSKKGGRVKFKYADLDSIYAATEPSLSKKEIVFIHSMANGYLITELHHSSDQWVRSTTKIPVFVDPKETGAWLTYFKRYQVQGLLGVSAEEDQDAKRLPEPKGPPSQPTQQRSKPPPKPPTKPQGKKTSSARAELNKALAKAMKDKGIGKEIVRDLSVRYYQGKSALQMNKAEFEDLIKLITDKSKKELETIAKSISQQQQTKPKETKEEK